MIFNFVESQANAQEGNLFHDKVSGHTMVYTNHRWVTFSSCAGSNEPSDDELRKHESLRNIWNEYLITRKLLGI